MFFRNRKLRLSSAECRTEKPIPLFRDRLTKLATVQGIDALTWSLVAKFERLEKVKELGWEFLDTKYAFILLCHQTGQQIPVTDPITMTSLKFLTSYGRCPISCINQFWAQTYLVNRYESFIRSGGADLLKQMVVIAEPTLMKMITRRAYRILKTGNHYAFQEYSTASREQDTLKNSSALTWLKLRLSIMANPDPNVSNLALQLLDATDYTDYDDLPQPPPQITDLLRAAALALS